MFVMCFDVACWVVLVVVLLVAMYCYYCVLVLGRWLLGCADYVGVPFVVLVMVVFVFSLVPWLALICGIVARDVYCCVYYIVVNSVVACGFVRGMFCFGVIVLGLGIWLVIWVGAAWVLIALCYCWWAGCFMLGLLWLLAVSGYADWCFGIVLVVLW